MTDAPYKAPEGFAKPWSGNYEAQRRWWEAVFDADAEAIRCGAGKLDLVIAHLSAAADIKGVPLWELIQALSQDERKALPDSPPATDGV